MVEVKDKEVEKPKIDPKTNKTVPPEPCKETVRDPKKPLNKTESTKVCPGNGGNHTDHTEFCALEDDSKLLNNRSGV